MKSSDIFLVEEEHNFLKWVIDLYSGTLVEVVDDEGNIVYSLDK